MKGVENGCAADVDVAVGGFAGERRLLAVENVRKAGLGGRWRRQRWQIMFLAICKRGRRKEIQ